MADFTKEIAKQLPIFSGLFTAQEVLYAEPCEFPDKKVHLLN
jgi:hypothetical protein